MKIKVGIFFGGPSREREISFAGGRTVFDNLNKALFEPIPIFVDSHRNFILLDWQNIYKGSIRDFFPPVDFLPESPNGFQVYLESLSQLSDLEQEAVIEKVGKRIALEDLPQHISIAFLALHGEYGEDGQIQQQLDDLKIPYTGSGVRPSQIGMDKVLQKELMAQRDFACPKILTFDRADWIGGNADAFYQQLMPSASRSLCVLPIRARPLACPSLMRKAGWKRLKMPSIMRFFAKSLPCSAGRRAAPQNG